jgi:hypothetical protein
VLAEYTCWVDAGLPRASLRENKDSLAYVKEVRINDFAMPTHRLDGSSLVSKSTVEREASQASGLSLLEFLSSSFDHWGVKLSGDESELEDMPSLRIKPVSFRARLKAMRQRPASKFVMAFLVVAFLVTCLSVMCSCFGRWWDEDEFSDYDHDPTLASVRNCASSWAAAYRGADGKRRQAIELLFKCNIITMPEFVNDPPYLQPTTIDEKIQIGIDMLQEGSVSQWEARWQDAQQEFYQKHHARQQARLSNALGDW